jgi:signal transduction histidine kinase
MTGFPGNRRGLSRILRRSLTPIVAGELTMSTATQPAADRSGASQPLAALGAPVRRYVERRGLVLGTAGAIFFAVLLVGQLAGPGTEALTVLYVLVVALVGLELGLTGGVATAVAASAATADWMGTYGRSLYGLDLLVRILVFLCVGAIVGRFSDRMGAHTRREAQLVRSGLDLARLHDGEVMPALLAEHLLAAVGASWVCVQLDGFSGVCLGQPAGEVTRVPVVVRGEQVGSLALSAGPGCRLAPEDRLVVEALAVQAGVASENRRLLALEREQAALHAQIDQMQRRLGAQLRNAGHLLERHEQERRGIARQLQEEAAQVMAAALVGVATLERAVGSDGGVGEQRREHLEQVRAQMKECIADLRRIAGALRPPALDDLGIAAALERLAEQDAGNGAPRLKLAVGELPGGLSREVQSATYRIIEALLEALADAEVAEVTLRGDGPALRVTLEARMRERAGRQGVLRSGELAGTPQRELARRVRGRLEGRLLTARAQVELLGGRLDVASAARGRARIVALIPLRPFDGHATLARAQLAQPQRAQAT